MADKLYISSTPDDIKNAKGLHLITQNTPNGQATQIMLEELGAKYGTQWTTSVINISTNVQKDEWFLRLNPNGRIPTLVDNTQSPPVPVIETSAQLLYLLKFFDKEDAFGFKDEFERLNCLEWMFFWHVSLAELPPPSHLCVLTLPRVVVRPIKAKSIISSEPRQKRSPTQSPASGTRPYVSLASSRFVCRASTPASPENTSQATVKEDIAWQTSRPGAG